MKDIRILVGLAIISILFIHVVGCNSNNSDPPYPVYSYADTIINPPDVFQVVYNINTIGDRAAYITFKDDAVWSIEKLGDSRIHYWAYNDTLIHVIEYVDTLGLKGGYTYVFAANNINNLPDLVNLFTQFNKLELDYNSFEPKY